ncbi:hypothetical protein RF55_5836 [Lasius niger]|uniref:Uncharacterized protein n=1 Tax=Lasius niger TaxID=67767 RepID=A0A0J7NNE6_LASNI|nr:hypothetical protein RF55_5836 [Lasius niger]
MELFRTVDSSHVVVRLAAVSRTTTLYPPYLCRPTPRADPDVQPPYSPFPLLPLASNPRPPFCPRASQPSSLSYPLCPSPTTECTPPPARLSSKQPSNPPPSPDSLSLPPPLYRSLTHSLSSHPSTRHPLAVARRTLACLPACQPACLLACLPACLPACQPST